MSLSLASAFAHLECWTRLLPIVCVQVRSWKIRVYLFLGGLDLDFVIVDDRARDLVLVSATCCQFRYMMESLDVSLFRLLHWRYI